MAEGPVRSWVRATADRLRAGAQVVATPRGPVEFATGGEGPALLISHGTPGGYDQGLFLGGLLGEGRFRHVAVSRPGYLGTPLAVGAHPAEQAEAFVAVLDALGLARVAVVGLSGGGPSSVQFAARHPDRCWGLVLVSAITAPRPASERPLGWKFVHEVFLPSDLAGWLQMRLWRLSRSRDEAGRGALLRRFAATVVPGSLRESGRRNDSAQFGALTTEALGQVACPTLIVHGERDHLVRFAQARSAAALIPRSELFAVPRDGHGVLFTHSREVVAKVRSFLEAHAPAG